MSRKIQVIENYERAIENSDEGLLKDYSSRWRQLKATPFARTARACVRSAA